MTGVSGDRGEGRVGATGDWAERRLGRAVTWARGELPLVMGTKFARVLVKPAIQIFLNEESYKINCYLKFAYLNSNSAMEFNVRDAILREKMS